MVGDGAEVQITASDVRVEGFGESTLIQLGNQSAIKIGSAGNPVWGWDIVRVAIEPVPGTRPQAGLVLTDARQGYLRELQVTKFPGAAIDVGENCWSDRSIDNYVVKNDIGYNFHGSDLNAWNIRGGLINSNRVGINFELGKGKLQGFSIGNGTQLEANTDTAIRLSSGVVQGLFLSEIYAEIFKAQRLIKTEPGDSPLLLNLLSINECYVFSEETAPVYIGTRAMDVANVHISDLLVRHSVPSLPVAEGAGANTSIVVSESSSVSSTNAFTSNLVESRQGARGETLQEGKVTR
jgi:hypothetical protein